MSKSISSRIILATALALGSTAAMADQPYQYSAAQAAKLFEQCDASKDGMVSQKEYMSMIEKAWNKADPSKTGAVDKARFQRMVNDLFFSGGA